MNTTALLNRTLFWKDWKNSMAMVLCYLGIIALVYPLPLLRELSRNRFGIVIHRLGGTSFFDGVTLIIGMSVVLFGSVLVGEERKRNTYNMLLAMPFSRQQILLSKYVLGVVSIVSVYLINGLLLAAIFVSHPELEGFLRSQMIFNWVLSQIIIMLTIFSFTFVFATMTGTIAASTVLTGIFLVFPAGFVELLRMNLGHRYGYIYADNLLSPYCGFCREISLALYLGSSQLVLQRWPFLLGASVLMMVLALKIFDVNPMEKNGEVLVIDKVKPVFRIGVPVCFTLFVGGFFADSLGLAMGYVVGAVIGGLITHFTIGLKKVAS